MKKIKKEEKPLKNYFLGTVRSCNRAQMMKPSKNTSRIAIKYAWQIPTTLLNLEGRCAKDCLKKEEKLINYLKHPKFIRNAYVRRYVLGTIALSTAIR